VPITFNPIHYRRVVNPGDALNGPKASVVDIHLEAQLSQIIPITLMGLGRFNELTTAVTTAVVLLGTTKSVLFDAS